ncbi:MAG: GAF domain-containing protein [Chloroflexi bacterium]|nr:GAF domain-containing protein [Chloroflexota bacterium]
MSQRRLQLLAIAAPVSMVVVFALLMQGMVVTTEQHVVAGTIMVLGTLAFSLAAYAVIAASQRTILAQNRELAALNAVSAMASRSRDTASGLRLALGKVVEASRADAVEVLLWDEQLQQLTPWVRRAELPAWSTDLARLAEQLLAAAQEAQGCSPAIYIADIQEDGRLAGSAGETAFRSFASVPLRVKERTLGIMNLAARRPGILGPAAEPLLSNVAKQIGLAAENSRLFQELQQREKEARILYQIATEVLSNLDTDRIEDLIVSHARTLLGADVVTLCLVDERTRELVAARRAGPEHVFRADPPILQLRAAEAGRETSPASLALLRAEDLHWHLAAPLRVGNEVLGEICVGGTKPRHVGEREHELLTSLASQAAIALSNARLYATAQDVAILEERDRIAREMHDSLAQVLGYLASGPRRSAAD